MLNSSLSVSWDTSRRNYVPLELGAASRCGRRHPGGKSSSNFILMCMKTAVGRVALSIRCSSKIIMRRVNVAGTI